MTLKHLRKGIVPPTMIAAIIGAAGVLLGLVVGRFWDIRSELRKWRRDQKVQAYQRLAEALFAMREIHAPRLRLNLKHRIA
jgi:hypothetical protein